MSGETEKVRSTDIQYSCPKLTWFSFPLPIYFWRHKLPNHKMYIAKIEWEKVIRTTERNMFSM